MLKNSKYFDENEQIEKEVVALAEVSTLHKNAVFYIGKSRELINEGKFIKKIYIWDIDYDRETNPYVFAYNFAKNQVSQRSEINEDKEVEIYTEYGPFHGWEDCE